MILVIKKNMKKARPLDHVFYLSTICDLKKVKGDSHVILLFGVELTEEGIVKEYAYFLEEVFISVPVKLVLTNLDNKKLREICEFHNVEVQYI